MRREKRVRQVRHGKRVDPFVQNRVQIQFALKVASSMGDDAAGGSNWDEGIQVRFVQTGLTI